MKTKKLRFFLLLIILTLGLSACDRSKHLQDLKDYVKQLKAASVVKKPPVTKVISQLPKPVNFTVDTGRSPFEDAAPKIKDSKALPLQAYSLNQLQFKGTIMVDNVISAYILTPEKKIYQAKIGDMIGDHYGRIKNIYSDHIEIEEQGSGTDSGTTQQIVTLQLKDGG